MQSHDVTTALEGLNTLEIRQDMTEADAASAMRFLAVFNQCMLGLTRFSGQTPWERHPDGDELLYVMEGGVELTILHESRQTRIDVPSGSIAIVPRGLWHRQRADTPTALLFATPAETTEHSWADDPRLTR